MERHLDSEDAERYSRRDLSKGTMEQFDEHLLLCEECQARVLESDAYVRAMSGAARAIRGREALERRIRARPRTRAANDSKS